MPTVALLIANKELTISDEMHELMQCSVNQRPACRHAAFLTAPLVCSRTSKTASTPPLLWSRCAPAVMSSATAEALSERELLPRPLVLA